MKPILYILACFFAFSLTVYSWDDGGHMAVAQLAYDQLTPAEQRKLDGLLTGLDRTGQTYNAVSAACWMDDVRGDTNLYHDWHFVDIPFDGTLDNVEGEDALWALEYARAVALGQKHGDEHLKGVTDTDYIAAHPAINRAEAVAMVIHLVGDIHQPLHAIYNSYFDGNGRSHLSDLGGNSVKIVNAPTTFGTHHRAEMEALHHFWDSAYQQHFADSMVVEDGRWARPTTAGEQSFRNKVNELVASHAADSVALKTPTDWVNESHQAAKDHGYGDLGPDQQHQQNVTLNKQYVTTAQDIACQRLHTAGTRLAAVLKELLAGIPD